MSDRYWPVDVFEDTTPHFSGRIRSINLNENIGEERRLGNQCEKKSETKPWIKFTIASILMAACLSAVIIVVYRSYVSRRRATESASVIKLNLPKLTGKTNIDNIRKMTAAGGNSLLSQSIMVGGTCIAIAFPILLIMDVLGRRTRGNDSECFLSRYTGIMLELSSIFGFAAVFTYGLNTLFDVKSCAADIDVEFSKIHRDVTQLGNENHVLLLQDQKEMIDNSSENHTVGKPDEGAI